MSQRNVNVSLESLMERLETLLGSLGRLVVALMGAVVALQITLRVLPIDYMPVWTTEIARYLLVVMTLTGIPYAMRRGNHISIRPLLRMLSDTRQRYLLTIANLLVVVMCAIGIWSAINVIDRTLLQSLPTIDWLTVGYLMIYLAIAFALCIVVIFEKMASMWIEGRTEPGAQDHPAPNVQDGTEPDVEEGR